MSADLPENLEDSVYFKLLKFAVEKGMRGETFIGRDAVRAVPELQGVEGTSLWYYTLCQGEGRPGDVYRIKPEAFLAYLQYVEIRQARAASQQAERHAQKAQRTAIYAIVMSILLGIITLGVGIWQGRRPVEIDHSQIEELKTLVGKPGP